ncbi:unnamed protein product [Urochloa humidicola]
MAAAGWSSLPADLLKEVSGRLSSDADLLHIHQVCPHWRASTSLPSAWRPWVLACSARWSGLEPIGDYSLRLPRRGAQRMEVGAPPASFPYCCGMSRGWLALVDNVRFPRRLLLWEPLSKTEISLPCPRPLIQIFVSDDPLISPNWFAVATQPKGQIWQKTLLWRPGDANWTVMYERATFEIDSIAFLEGKAYYIDVEMNIIICDLSTGTDPSPKCTRMHNIRPVVDKLCKCGGLHAMRGVHLVACNGELLVVVVRWGSHPSPAEVYKPKWMPDLQVELQERVMDLGDNSLFVGLGDTFSLSAKEFPSVKRNCVYYADNPDNQKYCVSVFHLGSDVVEEIPYPEELKQDTTNWIPYAWFCLRGPLRSNEV